jgi:hypothetical protein
MIVWSWSVYLTFLLYMDWMKTIIIETKSNCKLRVLVYLYFIIILVWIYAFIVYSENKTNKSCRQDTTQLQINDNGVLYITITFHESCWLITDCSSVEIIILHRIVCIERCLIMWSWSRSKSWYLTWMAGL